MTITQRPLSPISPSLSTYHPVLQRIYAARGITCASQLDKGLDAMLPFDKLIDIDKAAARLFEALQKQERILIVGDFDADGATSTALAVSALQAMGAQYVEFLVPNRFEFGYGLTPPLVDVAVRWRPNLIITVDNGIANHDGVLAANQADIDVLITDHHLPGETLPPACAIVNPNQVGDPFPSKSIAGVGVIFYVMLALRRHLITHNWFETQNIAKPNMGQFLDLVALGTVADVVSLDQNNRILVEQGVKRIRTGQCRPGIKALIEIANRHCDTISESDLGFAVAPRLNAAGRLDDMALGIECLLSTTAADANSKAQFLDKLNTERRQIELTMKEQAFELLQPLLSSVDRANTLPIALCLYDASWHQGVIGILAGRLKDRYSRPVIIFAKVSDTEMKGSARSVPTLNIRDILAAIDADFPGLITKFGGHAMAAGLSLQAECFEKFQAVFVQEVAKHLNETQCRGEIYSDGALQPVDLTMNMAVTIKAAGPWGQQFPLPIFDNIFEIVDQRLVGEHHLKLTLAHPDAGSQIDAIAFYIDKNHWPNYAAKYAHIAYQLDINEYAGKTKLQLIILEIAHKTNK